MDHTNALKPCQAEYVSRLVALTHTIDWRKELVRVELRPAASAYCEVRPHLVAGDLRRCSMRTHPVRQLFNYLRQGRPSRSFLVAAPERSLKVVSSSLTYRCTRSFARLLPENDYVLSRQRFNRLDEPESLGFDLGADLSNSHLVLGSDGDARIFAAILDQRHPSVRF